MPSPFPNLTPRHRGTVHRLRHVSSVLASNPWGDPAERDVFVYTPPGYDRSNQTHPAIFILPGFTGTGEGQLGRGLTDISIATRIDRLIADGCPPFIAVLPDCMTRIVGSQYVDSPGVGAYGTYIARELRTFLDHRFRTRKWGVAGKSSGGFAALHLTMAHPGVFHAAACHAGDMGFDLCYLSDLPTTVRAVQAAGGLEAFLQTFWEQRRPSDSAIGAMNLLCMACCYSPAPERRPLPAHLPVDLETGEVHFEVLASWRRFDPIVQVDDPVRADALRALDTLFIDVGRRDEYLLHLGARRLTKRLRELDIPHHYDEFDGGHRGTSYRYDVSLPALAQALTA